MKPISGKRMCKVLERHGWIRIRKGKHHVYGKPGTAATIPVPYHTTDLAPGTQRQIMRQAGLTDADL